MPTAQQIWERPVREARFRRGQTRLGSALEQVIRIVVSFVVAMLLWQFVVAPLFGYEVTIATNFGITSIFATASFIQGYLWRRFFEWRLYRD